MQKALQAKNPNLIIQSVEEPSFNKYGRILQRDDFSPIFEYLRDETLIPATENVYIANDPKLESKWRNLQGIYNVFGDMPVQLGYVNGNNSKLNSLEYHKSSEVDIALTPLVLFLARAEAIRDNQFNSDQVETFYVPANTVFELYPLTLHFSPCKVSESGFKCGVILPYGTNMNFIKAKSYDVIENQLLLKTNKWLLAHKEHQKMIDLGAYVGLVGPNLEIHI